MLKISKVKTKVSNFKYNLLDIRNEDESEFTIAPMVLSKNGYEAISKVYKTNLRKVYEVSTDNKFIQAVGEHRLLTKNGWIFINDLKNNTEIYTKDGYEAASIEEVKNETSCFDFQTDKTKSYYTNGILSHNSLLCEMAMVDPTIDLIIYFDTEAAFNINFFKFLGGDPEKVLYQPIDTVEQLITSCREVLDTIIMNKQVNKKVLMIIDSIALASTEKEMDPESGSDMGYRAKKLREFFRVFARKIEKYSIGMLATNHYTQKIGVMFGPKETTTGGTALPYAASVRLDLKVVELEIDKKLESLGASSTTIRATTVKNRCFSPKRKITFLLDFERGVDRFSGLFKILLDFGLIEKNGSWRSFPAWSNDKFYAKDFARLVEKHNLMPIIQKEMDKVIIKGIAAKSETEEEVVNQLTETEEIEEQKEEKKRKKRKLKEVALAVEEERSD